MQAMRESLARLSQLRALRYALLPPRKLYEPIFRIGLSDDSGWLKAQASCIHTRPGPYQISVEVARPIENPIHVVGKITAKVSLEGSGASSSELVRENSLGETVWWSGPHERGFGAVIYGAPGDVALGAEVNFRVLLKDVDGALAYYEPKAIICRNCFYV